MKVLCAGDLHIGRRPTRLPPGADSRRLSCARAWEALVEYAVDQRVDVLALSGDVVDQSNKFYEAIGPLERGLRHLAAAGVVTVAVAGNHDYDVLPQIARSIGDGSFRLLGAGGEWERFTIKRESGETLHVDGWSFPAEHVRQNPLDSYGFAPDGDTPTLGLLHADLDAPRSSYAPVMLSDLQARSVALWLLGHIHVPKLHSARHGAPVLYPGSLQPMDPGEPGVHGAWLLELKPLAAAEPRIVPLASVRYAAAEADVTGVASIAELRTLVNERLRSSITQLVDESGARLHALSLRLGIVGSTSLHRQIEHELTTLREDFDWRSGDASAFVEAISVATRPVRDLDALARGDDAVALLARLARDLASPGGHDVASASLMDGARAAASTLLDARQYRYVADLRDGFDDGSLRVLVAQQSLSLLDELLAQKELA
ncbi:MAG TPA: DNA repair exonuclease [Gemmatimonadaceae bacterium]|jgi:DNA repair exonuclease